MIGFALAEKPIAMVDNQPSRIFSTKEAADPKNFVWVTSKDRPNKRVMSMLKAMRESGRKRGGPFGT